jgi:hypothetical protein
MKRKTLVGLWAKAPEISPEGKSYQIGHIGQTIFPKDHYEPLKIFPQTRGITKDKFFSPNLIPYKPLFVKP